MAQLPKKSVLTYLSLLVLGRGVVSADENCGKLLGECSLENLEELILSNASHLTAVSVQLLAENCPKLRVLGSLTSWDITPEELDALRILIAVSNTDLTLWPVTF
ncbi:hypothetical protein HUJ05_011508 [Dendroctonus ponderosae]|nr:hypothetical protein HUJ05_011508 [Dendroctonus ponderosae]